MTIIQPRDAGFVGGTVSWSTVRTKTKKFQSSHLVMQTMRKTALFSKLKKENKDYRILLVKTKSFLSKDEASPLVGKKWIVAEDDSWKEILASWIKLEHYLEPVLCLNKIYTVSGIVELLQSIAERKLTLGKAQGVKQSATTVTTTPIHKISVDNLFDVGDEEDTEKDCLSEKKNTVKKRYKSESDDSDNDTEDRKDDDDDEYSDDAIEYVNEAAEVMTEFQQQIVLAKSILKKADNNVKSRDKLLTALKQSELKTMLKLADRLDTFLKKRSGSKDAMLQKLISQYKELKTMFERDVLKHDLLKDYVASSTPAPPKKFVGYNNNKSPPMTAQSTSDSNQQTQQLQAPKMKLTSSQKATVQVEKAIALETRDELLKIEQDFNELNELARDMSYLLHDQGVALEEIENNVQYTTNNIDIGNKNLKQARRYANMKPF